MSDLDTMPAGDEIDRLVSEKVMGIPLSRPSGFEMQYEGARRWSPSTNIAHAWEVVESELLVDPDGYRRHYFQITETAIGWRVEIFHRMEDRRLSTSVEAMALTTPLAICRAALKAMS